MYEIWLMLNIAWEMAAPAFMAAAAFWVLLMILAVRLPGAQWRGSLPWALVIGAVVAVATFLGLPGSIGSSLGEMRYWVDWMTLLGLAAGAGAVAVVFAWPLQAMRRRNPG